MVYFRELPNLLYPSFLPDKTSSLDFVEIKNVNINSSINNQINISADIVLENPNKVKIIIDNINLDIYAEDIILVNINENQSRELTASSRTTVNITGDVNLKNLEEFLNKKGLAIILGNDDVKLKFIGKFLDSTSYNTSLTLSAPTAWSYVGKK